MTLHQSPGPQAPQKKTLAGLIWAVTSGCAIAGYGLLSFTSTGDAAFTAITIPFRVLVGAISILLIGNAMLNSGRKLRQGLILPLLLFLGLYILRMYLDLDRLGTAQFNKQVLFLLGVGIVPAIAMHTSGETSRHSLLINVLLVLYGFTAILGIRGISEDTMESGRLAANQYFNPIDLGHSGLALLLICAYRLMRTARRVGDPRKLILYGTGVALGGSVLALAGSRGPVTAGAVLLLCVGYVSSKWKTQGGARTARKILALTALIGAATIGIVVSSRSGGTVLERITSISDTRTGAEELRLPMYQEAFQTMLDNPIVGATTLVSYGFYPHNAVLEAGMSLGLPGATAMLAFFFIVLKRAFRLAIAGEEAGLLGLLTIQQIVACQFSGALWSDDNVWTFSLLIMGIQEPVRRLGYVVVRRVQGTGRPTEAVPPVQNGSVARPA